MAVLSTGPRNTLTPNLGQRALLPCNLIPKLVLFLFVLVLHFNVFTGCSHVPKDLSFTSTQSILALCLTRTLNIQMDSSLSYLLPFTTYLPIKITSCITSEGTSISSRSRNIVLFVGAERYSPHEVSLGDFFDYGYCYYVSLRSRSRQEDERKMKFNFTARWAAAGPRLRACRLSVYGFYRGAFLTCMMLYAAL